MGDGLLVASVTDPTRHDTGYGHPERAARVDAAARGIAEGAGEQSVELVGQDATWDELTAVHDESYLGGLRSLCDHGGGELDADTPVAAGSWAQAVEAAGLGLAAIDQLRAGQARAAFVVPRPPGHHATRTRGMGFCLLNNIAVAAAAIAAAGDRVVILDWDVHHGNGTQDIFWDDPRVLFASVHQSPAYPGTGRAEERGGAGAPDGTVNVPVPPGATGDVFRAAFDEVILPIVERFAPHWLLISAGFDAHRADPLADLRLSAGDFADLATAATSWVPTGRTVAFLEGGYDLDALRLSAQATAAALIGGTDRPEAATHGGPGRDDVTRAARARHHDQP
jgi:acetoin utilization deacetylase AcuC-like enzyme